MKGSRLVAVVLTAFVTLSAGLSHGAEKGEKNPHELMVTSKRVCIDCHTRVPAASEHAPNYLLVDAPSESCLDCHDEHEHPGVAEHMGKDAGSLLGDENGKIACFTCHDPHPEGVIAGRRVYAADVGETSRTLAGARALPTGVKSTDEERKFGALLRLSAANGAACSGCHDVLGDDKSWKERPRWDEYILKWPR